MDISISLLNFIVHRGKFVHRIRTYVTTYLGRYICMYGPLRLDLRATHKWDVITCDLVVYPSRMRSISQVCLP